MNFIKKKKIIYNFMLAQFKNITFLFVFCAMVRIDGAACLECPPCYVYPFTLALTSGYVWKQDYCFNKIYGPGINNILTGDACYYPLKHLGFGLQVSYWKKKGKTPCKEKATMREVPVIFFARGRIGNRWQGFASVGVGPIFFKEKKHCCICSYHKGIGTVELGTTYYIRENVFATAAFRYLFPKDRLCCRKIQIGGYGLRAGFGVSF